MVASDSTFIMKMRKNIRLLSWFNFFSDFRPYSVIAIIYFSKITGSYALGLSIFSIVMVSSALLELPTGIFSDKVGRKISIICGSVASVIALTLYALGFGYWILVLGAIFEGLSRSLYSGNNEAFLHEELTEQGQEKHFAEFLGKTSSMFQIALAVSALIGGFVAARSLNYVMWLSVIPQVVCLIISLRLTALKIHKKSDAKIYRHLKESLKLFLQNPKIRMISLSQITSYGIGETLFQFTTVFIQMVWPVWALGIFRALDSGFAAIGFWFSGKVLKKYDAIKSLIAGKVFSAILDIPAVAYPTAVSPVLITLTSFFFGLAATARGDLLQKEYSTIHRATMGSLNSLAGSIFMGLCAVLLGTLADKIGPVKSILIGEILVFCTVVFYVRLLKQYRTKT